jgi:hypothetical protein
MSSTSYLAAMQCLARWLSLRRFTRADIVASRRERLVAFRYDQGLVKSKILV